MYLGMGVSVYWFIHGLYLFIAFSSFPYLGVRDGRTVVEAVCVLVGVSRRSRQTQVKELSRQFSLPGRQIEDTSSSCENQIAVVYSLSP